MKITNLFILVLCITLFAACKPKEQVKEAVAVETSTAIYKIGDKIQVLWGSGYYPSTVVEIGSNENAGKYKIHYEGWSSGSDEWVKTDRIRSADIQDSKVVPVRGSTTNAATTTTTDSATTKQADSKIVYKVGDKITAIWKSGQYKSTILEVGTGDKAGKYKIHYDGWGDTWDEWIGTDRIK